MTTTEVRSLSKHVGEEVRLRGWLFNKRSKGKIHFLLLRDGTGVVQAVVFKGDVDEATFEASAGRKCSMTDISPARRRCGS